MMTKREADAAEEQARIAARIDAEPFPFPYDGNPGDPDYLSAEQLTEHWTSLQERIAPPATRLGYWRELAIAACTLLVIGASLVWFVWPKSGSVMQVVGGEEILPDGQRGPESVRQLSPDPVVLLHPSLMPSQDRFSEYRVDVLDADATPPRVLISERGLQPHHRMFDVLIARSKLPPGHRYQVIVYGVSGSEAQPLSTYTFRR